MGRSALQNLIAQAPPALCDILDSERGAAEPPIRAEIFGPQRFAQHGRSLGETHRADRHTTRAAPFFPRLQSNIRTLREAHRYIGAQAATGYDISPAAEWLLDNFHLIEAQLEEVRDSLPRSYFRALPVLLDPPLAGLPRVYGVAWAFVAHTDGAFSEELLVTFLCAYQEARELNLGEIWALPTTLRVVLIENLRRLAERVATHKAAREVANLCCDRIDSLAVPTLAALLALLERRGVGRVFLAQMAQRLQEFRATARLQPTPEQRDWLQAALPDRAAMLAQQTAGQAADNLSVSNAVSALRAIGDADWPALVARSSTLMRLMLSCPLFEAEQTVTRDQTLHAIEQLARRCGHGEVAVAQVLLERMQCGPSTDTDDPRSTARHWLRGAGRPALVAQLGLSEPLAVMGRALARRGVLPAYLATLGLGTLALVAMLLGRPGDNPWSWALAAGLMLIPASEAVVALVNRLISESARPDPLPRLALNDGIPPAHRVMLVVPAMLTSKDSICALVRRLHLHYLANPEPQAQFALLTDWADADTAEIASDASWLALATREISALNRHHPRPVAETGNQDGDRAGQQAGAAPRFLLLHRSRRFCQTEQRWIGWERKRGKLEQLVAALAEGRSEAFHDLGEASCIAPDTRYILTLDSDTQLPPGRLRELVGVAAHPHNQPRLAADGRSLASGYGILQPRVVTPLPSLKQATRFHRLFAGQCGVDPYSAATSEVYQDLFDEGSFSGKGLLVVSAMQAVLAHRLPDDQVLSHDLLEGALVHCATVTDITVVEDAPFHADVASTRLHRWTRGDWQLLPLLLQPRRFPVRAINRWKLFDNLRRSLVAPVSLALLALALAGGALSPLAALGLVLAALLAGPLMGAVAGLSPSRDDLALLHFYRQAGVDLLRAVMGGLWGLQQLGQQALMAGDAISRTLWRLAVSRRHLLQWTPFAAIQAQARADLTTTLRRHWPAPMLALATLAALLALDTPHPLLAVLLCGLWASAPLGAWWVSRTMPSRRDRPLPAAEQAWLGDLARDTWRFYEHTVTAADRHLPPDNLQILPHETLARRTSPTNIGLYLLSAACAREFGWIGTQDLLDRLEATLDSLDTLPRHRGHFMNWTDTSTGAALLPAYVSTVDSGNLCSHLLAVAQACNALAAAALDAGASKQALDTARRRVLSLLGNRHGPPAAREALCDALADRRAARRSAALDDQARSRPGGAGLEAATQRLQALVQRCQQLAWAADFRFLYHRQRHLFHIGFRIAEQALDAGFYDLLASESRLTSLLAIAKGDVPVRHWSSLGRPFFGLGSLAGLRSWSGSMFEYLMPTLVLAEPPGSVLNEAGHAALHEQMAFAQAQTVPWGISESAYAGRDQTLAYQYAPQGVPRLALRRTPPDELVIAPYATALALLIAPHHATANLVALAALGARGRFGFIEALDFTPLRQAGSGRCTPVATFMAHHQGMSLVALANTLMDGVTQRWGMADPHLEAMTSLLHERAPRELPRPFEPSAAAVPQALVRRAPGLLREVMPGATALAPTHLLSNGRYHVALRANGAGFSRRGNVGISRWRDDALRDALGSFLYLRWDQQPQAVSLTQHPAPDPAAQYQSVFHADRVVFEAQWPELQARTTVWVSPEDDIEFRQVELHNLGDRTLELDLLSAFEVTLTDDRADEAHPAFTNLFVRTEWQPQQRALHFQRTPRLQGEPALRMAHFVTDSDPHTVGLCLQTDRARWAGRNRSASQPLAAMDDVPTRQAGAGVDTTADPGIALVTGLDPVCALGVRLRIPPQGKAQVTFATAASVDAGTLHAVIDKYHQAGPVQRASLMSATLAGIRLRALHITAANFAAIQSLTTALVLSLTRPQAGDGANAVCDRRLLWRFGLSGDRPLLLVSASSVRSLGLLRPLTQALRLWSWGGVGCDLVVVNAEPASYLMALQHELTALRERHAADSAAEPGPATVGFHVLRAEDLSADDMSTLQSLARVRLEADGRPLVHHVLAWAALHEHALEERQHVATTALARAGAAALRPVSGRFDTASGDFRFEVDHHQRPDRPWINVLANPDFGAQLSEAGGGYTWAGNSRMHQLTAWSNDPVADPPSEWLLLQDRKTRQAWSLTPSAWGDPQSRYRVVHGQGFSRISHRRGDVEVTVTWCVAAHTTVKQVQVQLVNHGPRTLQLRLIGIAEWMMGASRADRATVSTALHRQRLPDVDGDDGQGRRARAVTALLCTQRERSAGFGGATAFLALAGDADDPPDWTCDRRECFDARGRLVVPDHGGQHSGAGLDPCAWLACDLVLPPGGALERVYLLGHGHSPDAARGLAAQAATVPAAQRLAEVRQGWDRLLGAATVSTPDPLFDVLVNRWLLYQTVSCRLWAKAGFYQAGGATGFRDQLQDAMALAWAQPQWLRAQILLCASRQFAEGDVQHWWHEPGGAGVRTHFSDDLLWLPHACVHHLRATGDTSLLAERVPFIEGVTIPAGAEDAYATPTVSADDATVYEHAARAIDRSLRVGVHGLPLMGSGDWNDGMNRVGHEGRGESVWLGWFLCRLVADFAPLAHARGEGPRAHRWEQAALGWRDALLGPSWDGQWFKRAFFDDGQPLGSHGNPEARIDLIAQAWSVLSGVCPPALQQQAMDAVAEHLVDRPAGLVRLLQPPLVNARPSAGYIQAYPPGVRENGGQYAHAAVWALMAQAQLQSSGLASSAVAGSVSGRAAGLTSGTVEASAAKPAAAALPAGDRVWDWFTGLSPAHRASHPTRGPVYGLEPYVMAGDIYSQPPYVGRGGWSWYTGAAAWLQRAAVESIFGLQLDATRLVFTPCLPTHWPRAELTLRRDGRTMRFVLLRGASLESLAPAKPAGAGLLWPGQALDWPGLDRDTVWLVPLLTESP